MDLSDLNVLRADELDKTSHRKLNHLTWHDYNAYSQNDEALIYVVVPLLMP